MWQEWQRAGVAAFPPSGRRAVFVGDLVVTFLWRSVSDRIEALAVAPSLVRGWAESASAPARQVGARLSLADGSGHQVEADAAALTHALWNLLDNAVKYSGDARTVWVSVNSRPEGTAISVRDEGAGIPRREQKEIFRKFARGEQARRLGIQGTGIGLAIVSHIVRAHGGKVTVESRPGEGSMFTIELPKSRERP